MEPKEITPVLTPRQQKFIDEYMISPNATQAAIRAGYSPKDADVQGPRLLGNVRIARVIEERQAVIAAKAAVSQEYVLVNLKDVVARCLQAEPVYDKFGHPTGEFAFDSKGATAALQLLGKYLGIFIDRKEITGPNGGPLQFDVAKMSMEEIQAELERMKKINEQTIDV